VDFKDETDLATKVIELFSAKSATADDISTMDAAHQQNHDYYKKPQRGDIK